MPSPRPRRSGFAGIALVVALIAAAVPGAVAGSWLTPVPSAPLPIDADPSALAASRVIIPERHDPVAAGAVAALTTAPSAAATTTRRPTDRPQVRGWTGRGDTSAPDVKARSVSKVEAAAAGSYRGRDRVWIPALGINRSVRFFACTSNAYPGDIVYRWGCAGSNNVYLFGHAHSVFKPLHDAYVRGALRTGMRVIYADSAGRVSTYAVRWWRVTTPDDGAWAYAAQGSPSLTLQTCVGSKSQYRLIVRLTKVG